ncbi:hypothetical protein A9Q99_14150 [Gammaproteobacteria bacterium 45_16_T64]|nr:hypothetical protein A9Q99_14150 [Gammaproteobacteria bacterium 45_16_T64]
MCDRRLATGQLTAVLLYCCLLFSSSVSAVQIAPYIPESLLPWEAWVMHEHKEYACPHKYDQQSGRFCRWPTSLSLDITSSGATFQQSWRLYREGWVVLPGDHYYWPKNVALIKTESKRKALAVVIRNNKPSVFMQPGDYDIVGEFAWKKRPESIAVPTNTGIISLVIDGQAITSVNKDAKGRLWFANDQKIDLSSSKNNSVTARVFRQVKDGVPLVVETRVELDVAGVSRELLLGRMQLEGFETIVFNSPLPARVEDDGQLRVQVKPGRWQFTLRSRQVKESAGIVTERLSEDWPEQEIWTFVAERKFRTVKISGVLPIDPGQTGLPNEWKMLPTYVVSEGEVFSLDEKIRGDASPDNNKLSLQRYLWLDFDGGGFTVKDEMNGNVQSIGRLSAQADFELGRVSVNGKPQVVTKMKEGNGSVGVEVRPGEMSLEAVGRISRDELNFSAAGWSEPMQSLSMNIQLPPGWMLFAASGADTVRNSWVSSWSLWHVFIFLVTVVCTFRIFDARWAVVAGVALLLVHDVDGAPWSVAWLLLLALFSLLKVVPEGRWRRLTALAYRGILLTLLLSLIPFAINQVRQAIYPQLEYPNKEVAREAALQFENDSFEPPQMLGADFELAQEGMSSVSKLSSRNYVKEKISKRRKRYDVNTKIQTGPGVPQWEWNQSRLYWSGPVTGDQQVQLWMVNPLANKVMNILRVCFLSLLLLLFIKNIGIRPGAVADIMRGASGKVASVGAVVIMFCMLGLTGVSSPVVAKELTGGAQSLSDSPSDALLKELEQRLLAPAACLPHCAAISQGLLTVDERSISIDLIIDATTQVVVPLPVDSASWLPTEVTIDGVDAVLSQRAGQMMLLLAEGRNNIHIRGNHQQVEQLNFPFKLSPHNIQLSVVGWEATGYVKGQVKGRNIQLTRVIKTEEKEEQKQLLADPAPAFVRIDRTLDLDIEWRLTTRVIRIAPGRGPINLSVPLLKGESLTTDFPVEDGKVLVSLRAKQNTLVWESIIQPRDSITLLATQGQWTETWNILPSQRWHVDYQGILPIKQEGRNQLSWWPIAGDQVTLRIEKPAAVEGRTLTLQSVDLLYEPGARATKSTLSFVMRSSVAGEYSLTLPGNVDVESVIVDGESQVRADDSGKVVIPVKPGEHRAEVHWLSDDGARFNISTPEFDLMQPASNLSVRVSMPRDRWTIFVGGPSMGPALLFWGVALVILAASYFLGRASWSILKPYEWALLGLGVATTFVPMILLIIGWFFAMHWRQQWAQSGQVLTSRQQTLVQWAIGLLTALMLFSLLSSVASSLVFGTPEMQISGNGSSASWLNWYQDRTDGIMPSGWIISLHMGAYRLAMLVWSLWLAFALLRWLRWGWECFTEPMEKAEAPVGKSTVGKPDNGTDDAE